MIETPFSNNRSWFLVAAVIAFVAVLGFSVFLAAQNASLEKRFQSLQSQKETLESEASRSGDTENTVLTIRDQLRKIEDEQIVWSKIVEKIDSTVPRNRETNAPVVIFQSYNGSEDGKVSVSAVTRSDSGGGFADIAALIRTFSADSSFKRVFIPSITKSITPEGATVLSFSFNFEYQKPSF